MDGAAGLLKSPGLKFPVTTVMAASVRIDDLVQRPVCLLKADVEGYEPQVLRTAERLFGSCAVPVVQFELSRTPGLLNQTCAAINMLSHMVALGYELRKVEGQRLHAPLSPEQRHPWRNAPSLWNQLRAFGAQSRLDMTKAYMQEFPQRSFSLNLVGVRDAIDPIPAAPHWPPLSCTPAQLAQIRGSRRILKALGITREVWHPRATRARSRHGVGL